MTNEAGVVRWAADGDDGRLWIKLRDVSRYCRPGAGELGRCCWVDNQLNLIPEAGKRNVDLTPS
jgi:hypothetical protein